MPTGNQEYQCQMGWGNFMVFWNRFVPWKLMGKVEQKIYQYHGIDGTLKQIYLASILSKVFLSSMICYVLKYIPFIKRTLENAFIVIKWYSRYCLHSMKCLSVISIYIFKSSTCHTYVHHKHYTTYIVVLEHTLNWKYIKRSCGLYHICITLSILIALWWHTS